MLITVK